MIVTDDSGDISIDKNKGIVSHRTGTFKFTQINPRVTVNGVPGSQRTHVLLMGEGDFELSGNDDQPLPPFMLPWGQRG
jgi:hypothetical protein